MTYLVLARKYRPQTFHDVLAQSHVTQTLTNAISAGRVAHAILFSGPRGTGKTTVARILAKAMNCEKGPTPIPCNQCRSCREITSGNAGDVFEIDGASNNSVDQVRELRDNLKYRPTHSPHKIYIIDEVHMLSTAAFNALLKTLEEPPDHVLFMFATTEPHKIPVTILSRCQRHDLRRIDLDTVVDHMRALCGKEKLSLSDESLWEIARESEGSMRDALSLLDQVMAFAVDEAVPHETVLDILGVIDRRTVFDLSTALINGNIPGILDLIDEAYARGTDLRKMFADLLTHIRHLMVVKLGHQVDALIKAPAREIEAMRDQVTSVSSAYLSQIFEALFREEANLRYAPQPKIAMEMGLIKIVQIRPALTIEALIEGIDTLKKEGIPVSSSKDLPPDPDKVKSNSAVPDTVKPERVKPELSEPMSGLKPEPKPAATSNPHSGKNLPRIWEQICRTASEQVPAIKSVLAQSQPRKTADGRLDIEVSGPAFNAGLIRQNKEIIARAARTIWGEPVDIHIIEDAAFRKKKRARRDKREQMKKEAEEHPLVKTALDMFDGRIVDVALPEGDVNRGT